MSLFTSFDGRISRKQFWLGLLGMVVLGIIISWAALPLALSGWIFAQSLLFLASLVLLYPIAAIVVKRLHDRDKPAMPWAAIFLVPGVIANFLNAFKIGYTTVELAGQSFPVPGMAAYIMYLITMVAGLWMLIELGCRRGTVGSNRFGGDPVEARSPATEAA